MRRFGGITVRTRASLAIVAVLAAAAFIAAPTAAEAGSKNRSTAKSTKLPTWLSDTLGDTASADDSSRSIRDADASIGPFRIAPTLNRTTKLMRPGGWVGWRMLGAPAAPATLHDKGVVYRTGSYDLVQYVRGSRMREAIVVRKRQGNKVWRWRLSQKGPGDRPRVAATGEVTWGNNAVIESPALHKFNGRKVRDLHWTLKGDVLSLHLNDRKLKLPYVIDPPAGPDTKAPDVVFDHFTENTPQYTEIASTGSTLYYNPAQPGSFVVSYVGVDDLSGIAKVSFPNLTPGPGWSAGGDDTTGASTSGNGLNGSYQNYTPCPGASPASAAFSGVGYTRLDPTINFNWGTGGPGAPIANNCFTVRWVGYVVPPSTGAYRFRTITDDGIRVWVDGYTMINNWTDHSSTTDTSGTLTLTAGQPYPIVVDFNENGGDAIMRLFWDLPGGATTYVNVPTANLTPALSYDWTYSWSSGAVQPSPTPAVTATDVTGNVSTPKQFSVVADSTIPTGGSIAYASYLGSSTSQTMTIATGTDAASGVSSWRIERSSATLSGGACTGAWSTWTTVSTNPTAGSVTLAGQPDQQCHQYRLVVVDGVGNEAPYTDSDIVRIDAIAPTLAGVDDGPTTGVDVDWINSGTTLAATWSAPTDAASGVATPTRWCLATTINATGCSGGIVLAYTGVGGATSGTYSPVAFTQGATYYACVRVQDNAGNQTNTCSDGARYDSIAPTAPSVNDGTGADIDVQASTSTLNANWTAGTDAVSGVASHASCVTTSPTGADCAGGAVVTWTTPSAATTAAHTGLSLATGTTYYVCVRSTDNAGNTGVAGCSDGVQIDTTGPLPPAFVYDIVTPSPLDQDWQASSTTLASTWSTTTDPSGILRYELCLTSSSVGADCSAGALQPFTSTALGTNLTVSSLSLANGSKWFACVRAVDTLGNVGSASCSDGVTVDAAAPTTVTVNDGTAADVTWTATATSSSANWSTATDAAGSGVTGYRYCVKGMAGGADCTSGTIYSGPTTIAATNATVASGLPPAGTQHRFCVAAVDAVGNVGAYSCSNGQTADTTAPSVPTAVADSLAADIDWQSSTTTANANWGGSTDGQSGLLGYSYCISTSSSGSDCAGAATAPWTANGVATTFTRASLTLVNGTTYYACVRAQDSVLNNSASACSDGVTVDSGPPTWPGGSTSDDGISPTDIDWVASASTLSSFWSAATDSSGVDHYEFCLSTATNCGGTVVVNWTSTGTTRAQTTGSLALAEGATYYSCVRAYDAAANQSAQLCSDGQRVDSIPPVLPSAVSDGTGADIDWLISLNTASANWPGGSDATSGIGNWAYCVSTGTACSGTIVKTWTNSGVATTMTSSGLSLVEGQLYYVSVRGTDVAGNTTPGSVSSNGQRVDTQSPPAPSIVSDGTGADISYQSTDTSISANWTSVVDPPPGVGVASGLQQFEYCVTTTTNGIDCAGAATVTWTTPAPATSTSVTKTGLMLANGTTYHVCVRAKDVAGNVSMGFPSCSNGVVIDIGPPTASWTSWTENSANLYSPGGNVLWYNPAAPAAGSGTATATVTATDPGAGMDHVDFPALAAAGWGGGGTDSSVGPLNTWTWNYTFTGGGTIGDPALNHATAYDAGGAFTGSPQLDFDIRPDSAAPTGGTMAALPGTLQKTTTLVQSVPLGSDADSGVARWVMDYQFAPLTDNVCGAWDPWVDGSATTGYFGTAVNGTTLSITHHLNDPDFNGVADYHDSFCYRTQVHVFDNVGNEQLIPANGLQKFDFGVPDVSFSTPANGSAQSGTFTISGSTDDVWAGGGAEYANTGSGIQQVAVTYLLPDGPDADSLPDASGNACAPITAFTGAWTALVWNCSWNTSALPDGTYTVSAQATDRAGNVSTIATRTFLLDNNAPIAAWHSWDDHANSNIHAVGNVAWVNPNASPSSYVLDARVTAYDAGSGVASVSFPALGAGWLPASTTAATFTSPVPATNAYTLSYTFTNPASLVASGAVSATATDGAGNPTSIPFEVRLDGNAPTGATSTLTAGRQSSPNVIVNLGSGSDGALESGIAAWTLRYDTAPLTGDTCGSFTGSWSVATTGFGLAPATYSHDVTALGSNCYTYMLQVADNVGNVGVSAASAARRVDLAKPTVAITSPASGTPHTGTFTVSGDAVDAHTGIDHVALAWTGPSSTSGSICNPTTTLTGSAPNYSFGCSWNTSALPDGTYTITATSYDLAGNVSNTHSITAILDNNPPSVGFHSFVESTPYTYWAGPIGTNHELWYNPNAPAGSYAFQVLVDASDPGGVNRVEFEGAGTGWTPGGSVGTQTVAVGPATRYAQTYSFDTSGTVADPATLHATAFDPANNPGSTTFELTPDTADPAAGSVAYANGFVGSTSVVVTRASGGDGTGSGIAGWQLQRADGTLSGASCTGWGTYATIASGSGQTTGTTTDTVSDPGCFRYQMVVTDNVGRVGTFTSASEVKVDLVPPTGSVVLSKGANPQFQYLATPTRLFVNTSAAGSGDFHVDVNASAASGILDVTFPTLATGFTGAGTVAGPGASFPHVYSWTASAGTPTTPSNVVVRSNSLGSLNLPFEVIADSTAPTAAAPTHTSGFTTSTSVAVSYTNGTDGTGSGIVSHQLERETGVLSGGTCMWNNDWTAFGPLNGPATQTDSTLVTATCYHYRTTMVDNVGNVGHSPSSTPIMVDTTPPTGATITLAEATNPTRQYLVSANTIWVAADPGAASTFTATVSATDPESGTGAAVFPSLGSTFTLTSTGPSSATYTWNNTATTPAVAPTVLVANGSGLSTSIPFTVTVDGAAPTGATIDQENGFVTDFQVDTTFAGGGDGAGSGIASWRVERRSAPYSVGPDTCGTWTAWTSLGTPASPLADTAVVQPTCYQYRIVEVDNVGNVETVSDGDTAKVITDIFPPAAFNLTLPTNPTLPTIDTGAPVTACETVPAYTSSTPSLSWTASSDAESGLQGYDVYVDGTGTLDANVAAPATSWTAPTLADGAHTLGVRARDNESNTTDAGPAFPANFRVDTAAPTVSLAAPAAGSWTSDTTPTLDWNASDANCLARIEVSVDGSAVAVASGTEGSWTPTAPLAMGMHTWSFTAWDSAGNSTTSGPHAFGIDTVPPNPFAITSPSTGTTVRGFIDVTWSVAIDADSGLAPATAYQVLRDGSVVGSYGPGATSAHVTGITAGAHTIVVRAFDAVGNATDTSSISFTGYPAIAPPTLVSPAAGAFLNVVPTLSWNWTPDGGPAPTSYEAMVDGSSAGITTHPTSSLAIADPGDGNHTWLVRQTDPYTGVVTSLSRTFVLDRTLPINPGPLTRVATTISWPAPIDLASPVASGIDHQVFFVDDGSTTTSATIPAGATSHNYGLLPDGTYTMWVRAVDRAGNTTDSPTITVVNDSAPPTAFTLTAPAALPAAPAITNGSMTDPSCMSDPTYVTGTPTLSWSASSDATSGLASYDVYVDGTLAASVGAGVTSWTPATALSGGAHTWYVVAKDNFGLTTQSTPHPMNVRVDGASPTVAYAAPAAGAFTSDTTPAFSWTAGDDSCLARVELTVGSNVYMLTGSASSFTPSTVLPEGPTTWSLRAFDSAGNVVSSGAPRTVNIDTTAPTSVTAIFPTNSGSAPEQMMTFQWSAGSDGSGSGVDHYDLIVDGASSGTGITATSRGTFPIYAGAHTWAVRAYDAVGNSALFNFSFTATPVPDTTPPNAFNLLTPADGSTLPTGGSLTWEPAWDFKGVSQYRVFIDGTFTASTSASTTSFTPSTGSGAPLCTADFDPGTSCGGYVGAPTFSYGTRATTTASGLASYAPWNNMSYSGWSASGGAIGVGDPTVTPRTSAAAGYDGNRAWTAMEYSVTVPATGADLRFQHRYDFHANGESGYDGGAVEIMVDKLNDGFANDTWEGTCVKGTKSINGVTLDCKYDIMATDGGFNAAMGGSSKNEHPLAAEAAFSGNSNGIVQSRMSLADFAGKTIKVRFKIGMDGCYTGITGSAKTICDVQGATNVYPAQWRIDDLQLANPALLPGSHTWNIVALDAAGNARTSNQTWTFVLP